MFIFLGVLTAILGLAILLTVAAGWVELPDQPAVIGAGTVNLGAGLAVAILARMSARPRHARYSR